MKRALKILVAVLLVMAALAAHQAYSNGNAPEEIYKRLRLLAEAASIIDKFYVDEVDMEKVVAAALNGMMSALDPHSAYLTPAANKDFEVQMKGAFEGIGAVISVKDKDLIVVSPIEDSPAFRLGVKAGDKIISINRTTTQGLSIEDAVNKLRGPEGTMVTIEVLRNKEEKPLKFEIQRAKIKIQSVRSKLLPGGVGYIRLSVFREGVSLDIHKELTKLNTMSNDSLHGLVLDLRNNPGGLLDEGVEVADVFMKEGLIVYTKGRSTQSSLQFFAKDHKTEPQLPLVVLVNEGSASASEIVAGALQDNKKALILGVRTFGKGSVQSKFELSDHSALKLTTAKYYTPSGKCIQAQGIEPDVTVKFIPPEKANETPAPLREKDIEGHIKAAAEPELKEEPDADLQNDNQLQTALSLLKNKETLRQWR